MYLHKIEPGILFYYGQKTYIRLNPKQEYFFKPTKNYLLVLDVFIGQTNSLHKDTVIQIAKRHKDEQPRVGNRKKK